MFYINLVAVTCIIIMKANRFPSALSKQQHIRHFAKQVCVAHPITQRVCVCVCVQRLALEGGQMP